MRRLRQPTPANHNLLGQPLSPQMIILADILAPQILRILNRQDILSHKLLVRQQIPHILRLEIELLHRLPAIDVPRRPHRHNVRVPVKPREEGRAEKRKLACENAPKEVHSTHKEQPSHQARGTYTLPNTGQQISPCGFVENRILVTSLNSNAPPVIGCV